MTSLIDFQNATLDITKIGRKRQIRLLEKYKDHPRLEEIDLIWCQSHVACCVACASGFKYGFNTGARLCPNYQGEGHQPHKVFFIDNSYHKYDHAAHLGRIKQVWSEGLRPKYVTVRDIMTEEQCAEAKIAYYSFEQVMEWAEEIQPYTENVIVIPKYDCLDKIPEKYVLGYSVPTSYGGTPMPPKAFKGRRVHLLGGSPNKQIAVFSEIPEEVVSLDGNYLHKIAVRGQVWLPDGSECSLESLTVNGMNLAGAYAPTNVMYIACVISIGNLGSYWHRRNMDTIEDFLQG